MQSVKAYYNDFVSQLEKVCGHDEAEAIAANVFEEFLMLKKQHIFMVNNDLNESEKQQLDKILSRLLRNEPLQYIIGYTLFCDLRMKVTPAVLIPRPETEELTQLILKDLKGHSTSDGSNLSILDIGTGSGCIAIALKKNIPAAGVTAIDISPDALNLANENALQNRVKIEFIQGDILKHPASNFNLPGFNIIVSNPPYITESEKGEMDKNVLNHEPHAALFVTNSDPLQFYKAITLFAVDNLSPGGKLYFEINRDYAGEIIKLLEENGFREVICIKDMHGNNRFIKAVKG